MQSTSNKGLLGLTVMFITAGLAGSLRAEGPAFSGFVDMGYNYNLNGEETNVLRGFDDKANSINLQNAEIDVQGAVGDRMGYRVDLMYGYDATKTHAAGFDQSATPSNLQFDVQQAYLTFGCPLTGGTFTAGKFVTPFGVEVIESKDNYNTSRGFLFNYAIPFTHTGLKLDKAFADGKYTASAGLVNGWDSMQDNNSGKTLLAQVGTTVLPKVSILLGGAYGPEQATSTMTSVNQNGRSLVDAIVKFTPSDKLTLIANYDWGVEEGLNLPGDPTASWQGLGIHANYALSEMFSVAARYENMDDSGSRTGTEQVLQSGTVTLQAKKESVIYRLEYRQDQSSRKVFYNSDGMMDDDTQSTIGAEVILTF